MRVACSDQVLPLSVNTLPEPWALVPPTSSWVMPETNVEPSPDTATDTPKLSPASPSDWVRVACSVQLPPLKVNTVADP